MRTARGFNDECVGNMGLPLLGKTQRSPSSAVRPSRFETRDFASLDHSRFALIGKGLSVDLCRISWRYFPKDAIASFTTNVVTLNSFYDNVNPHPL